VNISVLSSQSDFILVTVPTKLLAEKADLRFIGLGA